MKKVIFTKQMLMYVVLTGVASFGALTAIALYTYPVVAVGIVSIALIYFVVVSAYQSKDRDAKLLLQFPQNIRYFIYAYIVGLLLLLALAFTVSMIVFLI